MTGKKLTVGTEGVSTAFEHKDVRSDAVPSLRSKSRRKRYQHANAELIGTVRDYRPTVNLNQHLWNEKNIFQMQTPAYNTRVPRRRNKQTAPVGVRTNWVSEEISRVLYETDEEMYRASDNADSDLEMLENGEEIVFGGFENRGELVWDSALKVAEEKWVDGVLKKEWEVVDDGREDEVERELEEYEGFQLL